MFENETKTIEVSGIAVVSRGDDLLQTASDPGLDEDQALALLKSAELPAAILEALAKNSNALKSRKVKLALACHAHTPRHVSISLVRPFYTFDLLRVAVTPSAPADVKVVAEDALISRLKTVTLGERFALARRASGRVAAALLLDSEPRVMEIALENGRLTEPLLIQAILRREAKARFISAVAKNTKWCFRQEVRTALLRTEFLPLDCAIEFSRGISHAFLCEILSSSRLPETIKQELLESSDRS